MGRLQRKKTASQKNKQKKTDGSSVTGEDIQSNDKNMVSPSVKPKVLARKSVSRSVKKVSKENIFIKAMQFFREVKIELKKVTYPSQKQTIASTVVVIILVIIIAFFLGLVDLGLSSLVQLVLR